jgi:hypothetical protein
MAPACIHDDIVVLLGNPIELLFLGEFCDMDARLQTARLALRLPAQARSLLDVKVCQQDIATGTGERNRSRSRER